VARVWESTDLCKALYRGALACHKLNEFDVAMEYLLRAQTIAPTVRVPPSLTLRFRFSITQEVGCCGSLAMTIPGMRLVLVCVHG
jgi:hypothetical protein